MRRVSNAVLSRITMLPLAAVVQVQTPASPSSTLEPSSQADVVLALHCLVFSLHKNNGNKNNFFSAFLAL